MCPPLARALLLLRRVDRLDTRAWNLSVPITALSVVGCGPQVVLEDGTGHTTEDGTDTDADTSPPTISDTETSPVTTSPPPQCTAPEDCGPGYTCRNDVCVPDDDYCYGDYGGYYGGDCCYSDCCYGECYYNECEYDADCGPAALCESYAGYGYDECVGIPLLEECGPLPELAELPVPPWGAGVVSLAFVQADGDGVADLVVGRAMGTELVRGPGDAPPISLPVGGATEMAQAVAGDFDGDGIEDVAVVTTGGLLSVVIGDGLGGFTGAIDTTGVPALSGLAALQWNEDGTLDFAGYLDGSQAFVVQGDGMGGTLGNLQLDVGEGATSLAVGELDGDGRGDLVVHGGLGTYTVLAASGGEKSSPLPGSLHGSRRLATLDVDADGLSEIVASTAFPDWLLVEAWRQGGLNDAAAIAFVSGDASRVATSDIDGDGTPDVAIVDGSDLVVLLGNPASGGAVVRCQGRIPLGVIAQSFAVADFGDDARAEVAVTDADGTVHVFAPL